MTLAWPPISAESQETVIELLCSILSPIGVHRKHHIVRSRGKRAKRKAKIVKIPPELTVPPVPEIQPFVLVGQSGILRKLESLAEGSAVDGGSENILKQDGKHVTFMVVFVIRSPLPTVLEVHLPQLVHAASLAYSGSATTRLAELSPIYETRLCEALGLPRVSCVGILHGAPYMTPIMDLLRNSVPELSFDQP